MLRSDLHAERNGDVLQEGLEVAENELWLVNPTRSAIADLVHTFRGSHTPPAPEPVRVFAAERPLKDLTDDFLLASLTADLVSSGRLAVRALESVPRHSLLVTEETVMSLVECEQRVVGLTTTRDQFVDIAHEEYRTRWRRAEPFPLRTPPLSEIRETLAADLGPETATDFDRTLQTLESTDAGGQLDEVTISLLVAAYNGELLYDISRWGEGVRLASTATFSRTKNQLEEKGLIDTEKVPIDVGRPRLRLVLGEKITADDIEGVVRQAQTELF